MALPELFDRNVKRFVAIAHKAQSPRIRKLIQDAEQHTQTKPSHKKEPGRNIRMCGKPLVNQI